VQFSPASSRSAELRSSFDRRSSPVYTSSGNAAILALCLSWMFGLSLVQGFGAS